jgi:hypothetical protein
MAIGVVQTVNGTFHNAASAITVGATGTGNLLVVGIAYYNLTPPTSITDDAGNTYVQAVTVSASPDGPFGTDIWYAANSIAGATAVTVNLVGGSNQADIYFQEFSGVALSSPIDVTNTEIENSAASPNQGPTLITTNANDVLISVDTRDAQALTGVTAPWTFVTGSANDQGYAYYIASATGTYQAVFTPSANDKHTSVGAAFKAAVTGASAKKKASMFLVM